MTGLAITSTPRLCLEGVKPTPIFFTEADRRIVVIHKNGKIITNFTVQYDALIKGKWVEITRIDTCHSSAHRHMFNPQRKDVTHDFPCSNYNEGLTLASKYVTENFIKLRENYIAQIGKRGL